MTVAGTAGIPRAASAVNRLNRSRLVWSSVSITDVLLSNESAGRASCCQIQYSSSICRLQRTSTDDVSSRVASAVPGWTNESSSAGSDTMTPLVGALTSVRARSSSAFSSCVPTRANAISSRSSRDCSSRTRFCCWASVRRASCSFCSAVSMSESEAAFCLASIRTRSSSRVRSASSAVASLTSD